MRSKENLMNQPRHARRAGAVKGRALLLFRLARQDIRHHFAQAVLLVVAIAAATAVLSLAFALNGVNTNPYQQTMAATKGPDVVAQSGNDPYTGVTSPADLAALVALNHAKGVAAHSGPYPMATAVMGSTGIVAEVEGRQPGVAAVDQPKVTDGTWIRSGGVVVERSFAPTAFCAAIRPCSLPAPRCSACSRSRAWPSSSGAAWRKAPGGSDC
jgi:putative ABC transport system permease protein